MQQKGGAGKLVGGIILSFFGGLNTLIAFVCLMTFVVSLISPQNAHVTVNGQEYHGLEAAGRLAVPLLIFGALAAVMLFFAVKNFKAYKKGAVIPMQAPYGMPGQYPNMQQNPYGNAMGPYPTMQQPQSNGNMPQYPGFNYQGQAQGQVQGQPQNNAASNPFMNNQQ